MPASSRHQNRSRSVAKINFVPNSACVVKKKEEFRSCPAESWSGTLLAGINSRRLDWLDLASWAALSVEFGANVRKIDSAPRTCRRHPRACQPAAPLSLINASSRARGGGRQLGSELSPWCYRAAGNRADRHGTLLTAPVLLRLPVMSSRFLIDAPPP